jgi:hypothetical protein
MGDFNTMIGIRDYITRDRPIRLPAADLGLYQVLFACSYHAFQRDPMRYTLHFHFQQTTCCEDDVVHPVAWDQGRYFIGGKIEFFAHFVDKGLPRTPGGGIRMSQERSVRGQSGMMEPPPSRSKFNPVYFLLIFC